MKKKLILWILLSLTSLKIFSKEKAIIEIYYHDRSVLTIRPRNKTDVIEEGNHVIKEISRKEYENICHCLNRDKEISTISKESLNLELIFDDSVKYQYTEEQEGKWIRELDDFELNITYVIYLKHNEKVEETLIGGYLNIVKIDGNFFEIDQNNFNKLLAIIEQYIE